MHAHSRLRYSDRRRPLRGLIFDMDGTIADTRDYHMLAWRRLVEELGLGEREFRIAEHGFGRTNWAIFSLWWGENPPAGADCQKLSDRKEALYRELIRGHAQARPGFMELLTSAHRRGLRIGLATSGPRENALFMLDQLGIASYFHAVVWGHAGMCSKPHPDSFLETARRLGVVPGRCMGVEDSNHGLWAVRRAGMLAAAIAEQSGDLLHHRAWTPFAYPDFRPMIGVMQDFFF